MTNNTNQEWFLELAETIPCFMDKLCASTQAGQFLPALRGVTEDGRKIALGFSCFAIKIFYTLGLWSQLDEIQRKTHINFIKSFQIADDNVGDSFFNNAFVDSPVIESLKQEPEVRWKQRLKAWFRWTEQQKNICNVEILTTIQRTVISETKQAIATLAEVGEVPKTAYAGFPQTEKTLFDYLAGFDWTKPWGAGAHFSVICVLLETQGENILLKNEVDKLRAVCRSFIEKRLHSKTGGYFIGEVPEHGMLINGAMKVLTGLDWLGIPIHYPKQLIDSCLAQSPLSDGCHLVDAIYVLYRCSLQTSHRRLDIQQYCEKVLELLHAHYVAKDGGFSYFAGRSQTSYYGVAITAGEPAADIHGTVLLVWALAMVLELLDNNRLGWRVIRP